MKHNELTIEIPNNKVVDWEESKKQNKIVLKDKQLTYADVCKKIFENKEIFFIRSNGQILGVTVEDDRFLSDANNAVSKHQLECILAKNELANVATYLNDGWKPSKNDLGFFDAWVIYATCGGCIGWTKIVDCVQNSNVLFKSSELAKRAIEILGKETIKLALEPLGF